MAREIKFRGLRFASSFWEYGSLFVNSKGETFIDKDDWKREPVKPESVGQFTGLKDKNGKEIYEGDIVRNNWTNCDDEFIGDNWEVKFGEHETSNDYYASSAYGWYGQTKLGEEHTLHNLPTDNIDDIEIIGNIYENPDLLKGAS